MKRKHTNSIKQNYIFRIALGTALILLIPLVAMQFSSEWSWGLFDFVFIGTLLFGAGLTYELIARRMNNLAYRTAVGVTVATAVLLVWVNAAVGIIGDGDLDNAANLMYFGVLALGFISAVIAGFKPDGMSRALFTMAFAQALVPVIALIIGQPDISTWGPPGVLWIFVLNSFFALLWLGSALLFRRASR